MIVGIQPKPRLQASNFKKYLREGVWLRARRWLAIKSGDFGKNPDKCQYFGDNNGKKRREKSLDQLSIPYFVSGRPDNTQYWLLIYFIIISYEKLLHVKWEGYEE